VKNTDAHTASKWRPPGIIAHKSFVIFVIFMRFLTNLRSCLTYFDRKKVKYFFEICYFSCFYGFSCSRFYDIMAPLTTLCKMAAPLNILKTEENADFRKTKPLKVLKMS